MKLAVDPSGGDRGLTEERLPRHKRYRKIITTEEGEEKLVVSRARMKMNTRKRWSVDRV